MPTYEFRCGNGHSTDRFFRTMSAAPGEIECPECGEKATRQLSGGAGLLFKGSGFYLTDYGKNAHRKSDKEAGTDSSKPAGKQDAVKGESKGGKTESTSSSKPDAAGSGSSTTSKSPKPKSE